MTDSASGDELVEVGRLRELLAKATPLLSADRSNRPIGGGERLIGFRVPEDVAGLSDGLFIVSALTEIARALPALLTEIEHLRAVNGGMRESLDWFAKHQQAIESDVYTGHRSRASAASEWMREDDRDFRASLTEAFAKARATLDREAKA